MAAAGTPGLAHKALDALAGNWKAEVKCWAEPGAAPNVSQATAKASWALNGRFLESEFHGEMTGKAFTGRSEEPQGAFGFPRRRASNCHDCKPSDKAGVLHFRKAVPKARARQTLREPEGRQNCGAFGFSKRPERGNAKLNHG